MQTFKLSLGIDLKVVVPDHFLKAAREEAQKADTTVFLKGVQEAHPEDDDAFMLAIAKNALRNHVRTNTVRFIEASGLGGSVSPVAVEVLEFEIPSKEEVPVES